MKKEGTAKLPRWLAPIAAIVGPAAVMTAGIMGPGSTTSLLLAGAWFRYELLWIAIIILPAVVVCLDSGARVGVLSGGKGMLSVIRNEIHPSVTWFVFVVMVLFNLFVNMTMMSAMTAAFLSLFGFYPPEKAADPAFKQLYQFTTVALSVLFACGILLVILSGGYKRLQKFMTGLLFFMFLCFLVVALRGFSEIRDILASLIPHLPKDLPVPGEFNPDGMPKVRESFLSLIAIAGGALAPAPILSYSYFHTDDKATVADLKSRFWKAVLTLGVMFGLFSIMVLVAGGFALHPLTDPHHAKIETVHNAGRVLTGAMPEGLGALGPKIFAVGLFCCGLATMVVVAHLMCYFCLDTFGMDWHNTRENKNFRKLLIFWVGIPAVLSSFWQFPVLLKLILMMGLNAVIVPIAIVIIIYLVNKRVLMREYRANFWRNLFLFASLGMSIWLAAGRAPRYVMDIKKELFPQAREAPERRGTVAIKVTPVEVPPISALPDGAALAPNLVRNAGFEDGCRTFPEHWRQLDEEVTYAWQEVSYAGPTVRQYEPGAWERASAFRGAHAIRLAAGPGQTSGITQRIILNQTEPRPIELGAWCRAENVTENHWCDLAPVNVRCTDGTKPQPPQLSYDKPFVSLGGKPHGWEYRSAVLKIDKPIRYLDLKVEVGDLRQIALPADRTALVWVDELYVGEVGSTFGELVERGLELPPPTVTAYPVGGGAAGRSYRFANGSFALRYGGNSLSVEYGGSLGEEEMLRFLITPNDGLSYENGSVASFFRITLPALGRPSMEKAYERVESPFSPTDVTHFLPASGAERVTVRRGEGSMGLDIPYDLFGARKPRLGEAWRFNVVLHKWGADRAFAGDETNHRTFPRLLFADPLPIEMVPTSFGGRPPVDAETDWWVALSETFWGDNLLGLMLTNRAVKERDVMVSITGPGVKASAFRLTLPAHETVRAEIPYRAEQVGSSQLKIELKYDDGTQLLSETYPIEVPPGIDLEPTWHYFYDDEHDATVGGRVHIGGAKRAGPLTLQAIDRASGEKVSQQQIQVAGNSFSVQVDVSKLRVHEEPIADYEFVLRSPDGAEARFEFGRLKRPAFEKLPPIETVGLDEDGMLLVNGKRFFAVVSSLGVDDLRAGHAESSAMGCNVSKHNFQPKHGDGKEILDYTWSLNTYEAPCLWVTGEDEERLLAAARSHPAFLLSIAAEIYRAPTPLERYGKVREIGGRPVLYEYYNCGSWYDTQLQGEQGGDIAMCGVGVRSSLLTRSIARWIDLELAAADRTRGIFISLPLSIDRRTPVELVRCAAYLAIVHRANGIYLYMYDTPDKDARQIKLARGLALELRRLSPVILAPPTERTVTVEPGDCGVEILEREHDGKRYMIAVNPTRSDKAVTFKSEKFTKDTRVRVRFEMERVLPVRDGAFRDKFAPCSVHVYVVE